MTSTEPEQGSGENNIIEAVEMLTHGQGLAFQLRDLLLDDDDQIHVSGERLMLAEDLLDKIHGSFTNTISALDRRHSAGSSDQMAESGESSRRRPRSAPASRRRRREINESQSRTEISSTLVHDGHAWRKYGQKHILDAKHSRNYYKCTYKDQFGCPAKKHVQQIEDDPLTYRTVYTFSHTCTNMISNTTLDAPPASRMVLASTSAAQPADMNQPSSSTTMILNFQSNQHNSDDHNNNYNNNTLMKQEYPTLNDQLATEDHNIPSVVQQQMIPSNNNNLGCSSDVGGEVLHNMEDFMYYPPDTEDRWFD